MSKFGDGLVVLKGYNDLSEAVGAALALHREGIEAWQSAHGIGGRVAITTYVELLVLEKDFEAARAVLLTEVELPAEFVDDEIEAWSAANARRHEQSDRRGRAQVTGCLYVVFAVVVLILLFAAVTARH